MKSEWQKKMEEEFDSKEEEFLAQESKAEGQRKAGPPSEERMAIERRIENNRLKLQAATNGEIAGAAATEEKIMERMRKNGLDLLDTMDIALETDPIDILLAGKLGNRDFHLVLKGNRLLIFGRRSPFQHDELEHR